MDPNVRLGFENILQGVSACLAQGHPQIGDDSICGINTTQNGERNIQSEKLSRDQ